MLKWLTQWATPRQVSFLSDLVSSTLMFYLFSPIKIAQSRQKFDWKILTYEMTYLAIDASEEVSTSPQ